VNEPPNLRLINRSRLLEHVLERGVASRSEIALSIDLSKVTVTSIVNDLLEEGWLIESGRTEGATGRPAGLVELHPQAGTVIGLDVQPGAIQATTSDLRNLEISERHKSFKSRKRVNDTVLELLEETLQTAAHGPLRQVVIAVPAPVGADGLPLEPTNFREFDAARVIAWAEKNDVPVRLENDVKLAALAEFDRGVALGTDSFALLAERETGVGLGLFLGGRPYRGEHGRAGELALVRWPYKGRLVPLEKLPLPARETALAQLVGGLAVALDLSLILVHQGSSGAAALELEPSLRELVPAPIRVKSGLFGERGPVLGAMLEATWLAREWLIRQPPLEPSARVAR
jgi:predicted NBD/HSP70 family sugar kinase